MTDPTPAPSSSLEERLTDAEQALLAFCASSNELHERVAAEQRHYWDHATGPLLGTPIKLLTDLDAALTANEKAMPGLLSTIARLRGERDAMQRAAAWRGTMLARYHDPSCSVFSDLPTERAENEGLGIGNDCDCGDQDALLRGNQELKAQRDRAEAREKALREALMALVDETEGAIGSLGYEGKIKEVERARALLSSSPASEARITEKDIDGLNAAIAELNEPPGSDLMFCPSCHAERADYEGERGQWLPACPNCGSGRASASEEQGGDAR